MFYRLKTYNISIFRAIMGELEHGLGNTAVALEDAGTIEVLKAMGSLESTEALKPTEAQESTKVPKVTGDQEVLKATDDPTHSFHKHKHYHHTVWSRFH